MRISVIGLPASGKSALAKRISEKLDIPHIHLDRFWFDGGGLKVEDGIATPAEHEQTRAYVRTKVLEAVATESWVSDGFYGRVQTDISDRADKVVFLDIPLWQRLLGHAKRIFKPGRHPELNWWREIRFFWEIIKRTYTKGPAMRAFVNERGDKILVIRSWKEADDFAAKLS